VRDRANLFEGTVVLNLDGIDDRGSRFAFFTGPSRRRCGRDRAGRRRRRFLPVVVDGLASHVSRATVFFATLCAADWRRLASSTPHGMSRSD